MTKYLLIVLVAGVMTLPAPKACANPINGIALGVFRFPDPPSPPSVTTGVGTSRITWGIPCDGLTNCLTSPGGPTPPNSLSFEPILFMAEVGIPFLFGEATFFNGTVMPGTEIRGIQLILDFHSVSPTQTFAGGLRNITINNTPNTGDPRESADCLSIRGGAAASSDFCVEESKSYSAPLLAMLRPVLAFTSNSGAQNTPEGDLLEFVILGFGEVPDGPGFVVNPVLVPEPPSVVLSAFGAIFLAVWWYGSYRRTPRWQRPDQRLRSHPL